jgi:hypothetical protein
MRAQTAACEAGSYARVVEGARCPYYTQEPPRARVTYIIHEGRREGAPVTHFFISSLFILYFAFIGRHVTRHKLVFAISVHSAVTAHASPATFKYISVELGQYSPLSFTTFIVGSYRILEVKKVT